MRRGLRTARERACAARAGARGESSSPPPYGSYIFHDDNYDVATDWCETDAYEDVLSVKEIVAVLSYIKSQWPAETRKRHDRLIQQLRAQSN